MTQVHLSREQLYEAVWSEPAQTLAKRYGLSDVGLAKACKRLRIPKPGRGYWRQKECGKRVRRPRLPKLKPDEQEKLASVTFGPHPPPVTATREEPTGPVAEQKRYEAEHPITVPKHMGRSHPLVKLTREEKKQYYHKRRGLDIKVSQGSWTRALRIMNALVKALDRRGLAVTSSPGKKGPTISVALPRPALHDVEVVSFSPRPQPRVQAWSS